MKKSVLILSHQTLSMVDPIKQIVESWGYGYFILSSAPTRQAPPAWSAAPGDHRMTAGLHLTHTDIDQVVRDTEQTHQFMGCISVWDGYRHLMAYANQMFNATDITEETVALLRDKWRMRNRLAATGLSRVSCHLLDEARFQSITDREKYFIKPRTGLASMGTFPAASLTAYGQLAQLRAQAVADRSYAGVFSDEANFIIEGLIDGVECSFEISLDQGALAVLAVHEKLEVAQSGFAMLEGASLCPPRSLSTAQIEAGVALLRCVMATLGADTGVYHVEMKCDASGHWEIIEINPRIGGAYIVESTRLHSGVCLLRQWLALIIDGPRQARQAGARHLFFRVFFGVPGRTLARIGRHAGLPQALKESLLYQPGDTLPQVEREIFLGMALWNVTELTTGERAVLIAASQRYIDTEYLA
ncbi:acetyl-CoA carboxylase biotin carboxylase subunit family protein [Nissabacter sp. SGAir0207]|uniref:ATP-grasp domain-containing protein n=1 Tax=Nissabacter sp. SGAir0207 TaxID=2126321 RepID=UPI0010CD3C49|nr:ATP-grasp domain-containing protein [Nissabacter sp. SGAir0207]QCR35556.1 hypothetical protein C1N62_05370 [Nissabacter sp. SGAir0207]